MDLDAWLADDHRPRLAWAFVEGLDLTALHAAIRSQAGSAGRPAADPAVLMALCLYATVEGSGRLASLRGWFNATSAFAGWRAACL